MSTIKTNKLVHTANGASEFTLPTADGSAGQVLQTNGSGALSFAAIASGKFASYAIICDQKATDAAGGTPPNTNAFNVRDLNTELADPDGIVSISSNQFTLQAGSYLIQASAPAYKPARHQAMVWNVTDSVVAGVGTSEYGSTTNSTSQTSNVICRVTISGAKVFEIRHRVGNADSTFGFGVESNYDLQPSIYTIVQIFKEN